MANITKAFNFRNGVQVDDDNLIVNQTGLVGIGTTIPTEALDVRVDAHALEALTLLGRHVLDFFQHLLDQMLHLYVLQTLSLHLNNHFGEESNQCVVKNTNTISTL